MAGPNDFTGNFVSSTFQRLLQLSGSGEVTDGTGSLVSFLPISVNNALTASYVPGVTSTTPGGNLWSVQFNSASTFQGSNKFLFNSASSALILTGSILISGSETEAYISAVNWIDFNPNIAVDPPFTTGRLHWVDDTKTLGLDTDVNGSVIELGHQHVVRVINQTGDTISKGRVVYISGSQGTRPGIATASYTDENDSATTLGFVMHDIVGSGGNTNGYVVTRGMLRAVNTSGLPAGASLYLSSSGQYTTTKPQAPLHDVRLGKVIVGNSTNAGVIYVDIQNGYEIDELHNVRIVGDTSGDLIVKSGSLWINTKQLSGSYSITGSLRATSFTGSLLGTASQAVSSSNAGYAVTAGSATTATSANEVRVNPADTTTNSFKPFLLPKELSTSPIAYYTRLDETPFTLNPAKNIIRFYPTDTANANFEIGDPSIESSGQLVVYGPLWATELNVLPTTIKFVDTVNTASFNRLTDLSFISNKLILSTGSYSGSFTGSFFGTASWANSASRAISSSFALTASFAPSYVLNNATASMLAPYVLNSQTGSFSTGSFTGSFTGSLFGTASWAQSSSDAISSSYSLTASFANQAESAVNADSADIATAAYGVSVINLVYTNTPPAAPSVPLPLLTTQRQSGYDIDDYTGVYENSNVLLTNSNVLTLTGSGAQLRIGYAAPDPSGIPALPFYGTVQVLGNVYANSYTGSLLGTSSWATNVLTASFVTTAQTASYILNAVSSSFALTASYAMNAGGSSINTGSLVTTSSFNSFTASYTTGSFTGSFTGSLLGTATTASHATTASYLSTLQSELNSITVFNMFIQ